MRGGYLSLCRAETQSSVTVVPALSGERQGGGGTSRCARWSVGRVAVQGGVWDETQCKKDQQDIERNLRHRWTSWELSALIRSYQLYFRLLACYFCEHLGRSWFLPRMRREVPHGKPTRYDSVNSLSSSRSPLALPIFPSADCSVCQTGFSFSGRNFRSSSLTRPARPGPI